MRFARGSLPHQDRVRAKAIDAGGHTRRLVVVECATHGDDVPSHDRIRRIGQIIRKLGIGRKKQQPCAGHVESPDGDKCFTYLAKNIKHRRSAFRIAPSGNDPSRLVKGNRAPRSRHRFRLINSNSSVFGNDKVPGVAHDASGHSNAALSDQAPRLRSRSDAKLRQCSIETDDSL
jgi:hypothetical protein